MRKVFILVLILSIGIHSTGGNPILPNINGVTDIEVVGPSNLIINWTVFDDNLKDYHIYLNGTTEVGYGTFEQHETEVSVTELIQFRLRTEIGLYILTLEVNDFDGLVSEFITNVKVALPLETPSATLPLNFGVITFTFAVIMVFRTSFSRKSKDL